MTEEDAKEDAGFEFQDMRHAALFIVLRQSWSFTMCHFLRWHGFPPGEAYDFVQRPRDVCNKALTLTPVIRPTNTTRKLKPSKISVKR
jgi:hypothetical protein